MAKYKIKERSFIGGHLVEADEEIEYEGKPGSTLHPLDDEARLAVSKATGKKIVALPDAPPDDADLDELRAQYEALFGEKPHHFKKGDTLRKEIADKQAENGQQ